MWVLIVIMLQMLALEDDHDDDWSFSPLYLSCKTKVRVGVVVDFVIHYMT